MFYVYLFSTDCASEKDNNKATAQQIHKNLAHQNATIIRLPNEAEFREKTDDSAETSVSSHFFFNIAYWGQ